MERLDPGSNPSQGSNNPNHHTDQQSTQSQARDTSQKGREEEVVNQQHQNHITNTQSNDPERSSENGDKGHNLQHIEPQLSNIYEQGTDENKSINTGKTSIEGENTYKEGMGDNDSRDKSANHSDNNERK